MEKHSFVKKDNNVVYFPIHNNEVPSFSHSGTYEIIRNNFFNFINESYEAVSSTTFKRISNWAKDNGIEPQRFLSDDILEKLKKSERTFFTNDDFCNMLDTLYESRPDEFMSWNRESFFRHVGYSGGSDLENFALDKIFPFFFGKSLRDVATYSSLYSSYATRQRNVNFSQNYVPSSNSKEPIKETISIHVDTFPGIITRISEGSLFDGYVQKVLDHSKKIDIFNSSFNFHPEDGKIEISATSTKNDLGSFDWREQISRANPFVRTLVSPIIKSKIETENRQETLENIISTFTTGIFKDIDSLKRVDKISGEHNIRVGKETCELAKLCNLSRREQRAIAYGAPQHDLGKVVIPQNILSSQSSFKEEEFRIMQEHTTFGALMSLNNGKKLIDSIFTNNMRDKLNSRFGKGFADVVESSLEDLVIQGSSLSLYHQEYANGEGYPFGLENDSASRPVKLIQAIDFKDAFSSPRPYKEAHTYEKVISVFKEELENGHFDRDVGEFLLSEYFPFLDNMGPSYHNWYYENRSTHSNYEKQVIGALRGNLSLSCVYPESLVDKGSKLFLDKSEIYYTQHELESQIYSHLVGFYEDIYFQERLRRYSEEPNLQRDYSSLKKGRVFDVYSLPREDLNLLRELYPEESLKSQEHIRQLETRIPNSDLIEICRAPLEKNKKYKF